MTPSMLRELWTVIEKSQAHFLLTLDDASLEQWLLKQFHQQHCLNRDESNVVNGYIRSKLTLIRDLAQERYLCSVDS